MVHPFSFLARHKKKSIASLILILLLGTVVFFVMRPKAQEYVTAVAEIGDIEQTVEAVGTVISENDLQLKFPGVGIVSEVNVQEGDRVEAGTVLARLRAGSVGAAVAIQAAAVQVAQADLDKLEQGIRPEDIAILEAQVSNKLASLQVAQSALASAKQNLVQAQDQLQSLQQEAMTALAGQVATSKSAISAQLVVAETALSTVRDIMGNTGFLDAVLRDKPGEDNVITAASTAAQATIQTARNQGQSAGTYDAVLLALQTAQNALLQTSGVVDKLFILLDTLPETTYFSPSVRATLKTTLAAQRSLLQTAQSAISSTQSNLQSASAGYDTRISASQAAIVTNQGARDRAQADILTYQTALQAQQADLASKKAPPRDTDLNSAQARVRQAQGALAQASAAYNDTILRAPVSGTVTHVNIKTGESLPLDTAISLLGDSPFRVEINVSEVDVPKLTFSQSGSITLDAFPDTKYKLHVSEIDTSPTLVQGVSKYRAKLDFNYPHSEFKIGMTGDVTVLTGERKNVVKVPSRAVLTKQSGEKIVRILGEDKKVTEVPVTLGMEGQDGDVEVSSGLKGDETVVVLIK